MRTSATHPLYVSWVKLEDDKGALGLTLCPGKYQPVASTGSWDRQLDVDLQALMDMGVSRLISLITEEDMHVLRVTALPEELQKRVCSGITYHSLIHGLQPMHGCSRHDQYCPTSLL